MKKQHQRDTQITMIGVFYTFTLFFLKSDCGVFFSLLIFIISIFFSSPRFNGKKKIQPCPPTPRTLSEGLLC